VYTDERRLHGGVRRHGYWSPILLLASLAAVLALLFGFGQLGVQWLRARRSAKWPWTASTIYGGDISVMTNGRYGETYELTVTYLIRTA
jgi:hypothetical protein